MGGTRVSVLGPVRRREVRSQEWRLTRGAGEGGPGGGELGDRDMGQGDTHVTALLEGLLWCQLLFVRNKFDLQGLEQRLQENKITPCGRTATGMIL